MNLKNILHSSGDEYAMSRLIVSSQDSLDQHYFVAWDFKNLFEIWKEDENSIGVYFLVAEYANLHVPLNFEQAVSDGTEYFNSWLDSLNENDESNE